MKNPGASTKAPSSASFQAQMMQQYQQQQAALQQQEADFQAKQNLANQQALDAVKQQQSQINANINRAITKPVSLATLATSPQGVLGNPTLSFTKLGG